MLPLIIYNNALIPKMNGSNTFPYGRALATQSKLSSPPWMAFSDISFWSTNNNATAEIEYKFPVAKIVTSYAFSTVGGVAVVWSWNFQGSNDDITWTTLQTVTSKSLAANSRFYGKVSSPNRYFFYRIAFTATNVGNYFLNNLQMWGYSDAEFNFNTNGLVNWWKFEENTGTVAVDSIGGININLNLSNLWDFGTFVAGNIYGLNFTSMTTGLGTTASAVSMPSTNTITVWSRFPLSAGTDGFNTLLSNLTNFDCQIVCDSNVLGVYSDAGGFITCGYSVTGLSSGWHHIAAIGSGTTTSFYVDGFLVGTSAYKAATAIRLVGNYNGGSEQWGAFDDLRIYNRALTSGEISGIANKKS